MATTDWNPLLRDEFRKPYWSQLQEFVAESKGRDLRALWLEQPEPARAELLMRGAADTLAALHLAGFAHGDGKWSNLLWRGEGF